MKKPYITNVSYHGRERFSERITPMSELEIIEYVNRELRSNAILVPIKNANKFYVYVKGIKYVIAQNKLVTVHLEFEEEYVS